MMPLKKATQPHTTSDMFNNDQWFDHHPKKILGTAFQTKNEFNREVTRVKGSKDDLNSIKLPEPKVSDRVFKQSQKEFSVPKPDEFLTNSERSTIDKVIAKTERALQKKVLKEKIGESNQQVKNGELHTFDQVLKKYNPNISSDEIKAWVWYQQQNNAYAADLLKSAWSAYVTEPSEQEKHLEKWVSDGFMCYQNAQHIPSVIYYSGNIYVRMSDLLQNKDQIIKKYGRPQYDKQYERLNNSKPQPLSLSDPIADNRLVINPHSRFAEQITIKQLADGTQILEDKDEGPSSLVQAFKKYLSIVPSSAFKKSNKSHIISYYIKGEQGGRTLSKAKRIRQKRNAKTEGQQFFATFLAEAITRADQVKIEYEWNRTFNGHLSVDYDKVPIGFSISKTFKNKPLAIRKAQREGVAFIEARGTGLIGYDVGVGKTMTAILSIAQMMESGQCKRPLIVVPNQTYKNWISELRGTVKDGKVTLSGILPQYLVNELYNLRGKHLSLVYDPESPIEKVQAQSITVMTYEGFNQLTFEEDTWESVKDELYEMLNQGQASNKDNEKLKQKIEEMMGKGNQGGLIPIERLGFDAIIYDEVHNMKKSFTRVKGSVDDKGKRGRSPYSISSGAPSNIGLRAFMISQYILQNNQMRNVIGLSATPFTNSPLEIYSMLALFGYQELQEQGILSIKDFFDTFIATSTELTINSRLEPERKEVILGFNNLIALQQVIFKHINYKTGESANISRPHKITLPLRDEKVGQQIVPLPLEKQISTSLTLTAQQKDLLQKVENFVMGTIDLMSLCLHDYGFEEESEEDKLGQSTDEMSTILNEEETKARVLRGIIFAAQITLSPYLFTCEKYANPTAKQFVEQSPKITYSLECIRSAKSFCEQRDIEMSGQIIYSNAGVKYFSLIKEYLVKEVGFAPDQVAIINGGMSAEKKERIKDQFNAGKIHVLIGSSSIKEGMNLQKRSTDLYVLWLDWNASDIKQLEGRIWRQGNTYANVRIIFPLMENSPDIFRFQKHEEKTSRINEIWQQAGKENTFKLEALNPNELKYSLITDPERLAELMLADKKETFEDEISSLVAQQEALKEIDEARSQFNEYLPKIQKVVSQYRPLKEGQTPRKTETLFKIFQDYLKDGNTETYFNDEHNLDQARKAHLKMKLGHRDVLTPRGLDIHFDLAEQVQAISDQIVQLREDMASETGKEAKGKLVLEVIETKRKQKSESATLKERVAEFATLNEKVLTERTVSTPAAQQGAKPSASSAAERRKRRHRHQLKVLQLKYKYAA